MLKTDEKIQQLIDGYGDWFNNEEKVNCGKMTKNLYPYTSMSVSYTHLDVYKRQHLQTKMQV